MKTLILICCLLGPTSGFAQASFIARYAIAGGGGSSTNDQSVINGTIGQAEATVQPMSVGDDLFLGGFWATVEIPPSELLVLITNPTVPTTPVTGEVSMAVTFPDNGYVTTNSAIVVRGTLKSGRGEQLLLSTYGVQLDVDSITTNTVVQAALVATNLASGTSAQESITWDAKLDLVAGKNVITAQGISMQGADVEAVTTPVTRAVYYIQGKSRLILETNGSGRIVGLENNALLDVGRVYHITAVSDANAIFSNWVGNLSGSGTTNGSSNTLGSTAALSFTMFSNLVLRADFVPNPFPDRAGVYNGLFYPSNDVTESNSGFITARISTSSHGAYSAKLLLDGGANAFSGTFDVSGNVQQTVRRAGKEPLLVFLHLNLATNDGQITGSVSADATNSWTSDLLADRAVFNARINPATLHAGKYTLMLSPGINVPTNQPAGYGYATLTANLDGQVAINGRLGDGVAINQSVPVSKDGYVPLYIPCYSRKGLLQGWLILTNIADLTPSQTVLSTNLFWIKPASRAGLDAAGFTNTDITILGSFYSQPKQGEEILALTNGTLIISNGGLDNPLIYSNLTVVGNKLVNSARATNPTNYLRAVIARDNGVMTVTFRPTGAKTDTVAKGVVLQYSPATNAAGWFLNSDQSGSFLLKQ